jgi:hypothetical protein
MSLSVADLLEIQELNGRFVLATDSGDGNGRAATFLPDGEFQGSAGLLRGREAIAAPIAESWRSGKPNRWGALPRECQHWVRNLVLDGDGDHAEATSYIALVQGGARGGTILLMGRYLDTLRKVDGKWYFARRVFEAVGG